MTTWELEQICDALKEHWNCAINDGCNDENDPHGDHRMYCYRLLRLLNNIEDQVGRKKTFHIDF